MSKQEQPKPYEKGVEYSIGEINTGVYQFSNEHAHFFKPKKIDFNKPLHQDDDGLVGISIRAMGNFRFEEVEKNNEADNNTRKGG